MRRRTFIHDLSWYSAMAGALIFPSCNQSGKLNILVLGGTNFVGPAIVKAAVDQGHQVALFNRGITNPTLFAELPLIKGDREQGASAYEPLKRKQWDVVIDVWPEQASLVDEATDVLAGNANHYVFISSIAVYNNFQEEGLHENSEVVSLPADRSKWYYSEEKLAAEDLIRERFPEAHTILRAGPIKGWRDPAVDLLYWCLRLREEESLLAPGLGRDPLQFIDVNDVGRFTIMAAEQNLSGIFNCTGPAQTMIWEEFLSMAKDHLDSDAQLIWVAEEFLAEQKVYSFSDLPLWAPLSEDRGFMQISNQKLIDTGFKLTPIVETLDQVMTWHRDQGSPEIDFGSEAVGVGLAKFREIRLLEMLRE